MSANQTANWNAFDLWRQWLQQPPGAFVQPILPGWSLNINSNNSTAPETEVDIVAKHSYGRQIGRISDALRALILDAHPKPPETGPLGEFMTMWDEIEKVKVDGAAERLGRIASDLALLKDKDRDGYLKLRDALGRALKQTD
ncbi:hypothetical protein QTI33_22295 [Variovorax sp. J22P271]|uniref:hypothetical protein n=1 Tax=Variovorax davisae TaxID=3053515 RepID=UPI002574C0F0|nr:hypothetical protein [Variovorax sp. J22P271]MDM0034881.1 hypothetical protein [Variovorax sp. J22P271]